MRMQLLPGLIFAGSDIKAKIRPGIEASLSHVVLSIHVPHSLDGHQEEIEVCFMTHVCSSCTQLL